MDRQTDGQTDRRNMDKMYQNVEFYLHYWYKSQKTIPHIELGLWPRTTGTSLYYLEALGARWWSSRPTEIEFPRKSGRPGTSCWVDVYPAV